MDELVNIGPDGPVPIKKEEDTLPRECVKIQIWESGQETGANAKRIRKLVKSLSCPITGSEEWKHHPHLGAPRHLDCTPGPQPRQGVLRDLD